MIRDPTWLPGTSTYSELNRVSVVYIGALVFY